jgi:hypothetical protein
MCFLLVANLREEATRRASQQKAELIRAGALRQRDWTRPEHDSRPEDHRERERETERAAVREVVREERKCEFFIVHRPGLTPEGHIHLAERRKDRLWSLGAAFLGAVIGGGLAIAGSVLTTLLARSGQP